MKKTFITTLLYLLPFLLFAQNDPQAIKFANDVRSVSTFELDDQISIVQLNNDNNSFDIVAVNDEMKVLWKTTLKGYALKTGKFKKYIVAVAATEYGTMKGTNNTYQGFVIDPSNGKLLVEKQLYANTNEYMEFPEVFMGDGNFLKLVVRQSSFERRVHVALLGKYSIKTYKKELNHTQNLQVIELDEKLEPINTFKPSVISNSTYIKSACNNAGDLFISWLNGPSIEVYQYEAGKQTPSNQLNADISFKEDETLIPSEFVFLSTSESNRKVLYCSMSYRNTENDTELAVGKFDFGTMKKNFLFEALSKDKLKALQKSFVPINKKIDDPNIGNPKMMKIRYMTEKDGNVVTALSSIFSETGMHGGVWMNESAVLLNIHDSNNLNLKSQQLLPSGYSFPNLKLPTSYKIIKDKLHVLANSRTGMVTITTIYARVDINTGKWEKMELLPKKKISNSDFSGNGVIWFGNSFAVPYYSPNMMQNKFDITMQHNVY